MWPRSSWTQLGGETLQTCVARTGFAILAHCLCGIWPVLRRDCPPLWHLRKKRSCMHVCLTRGCPPRSLCFFLVGLSWIFHRHRLSIWHAVGHSAGGVSLLGRMRPSVRRMPTRAMPTFSLSLSLSFFLPRLLRDLSARTLWTPRLVRQGLTVLNWVFQDTPQGLIELCLPDY